MPIWWAECGPLRLDADGTLYRHVPTDDGEDSRLVGIGMIEGAEVPEDLEPDRAWLLDLWRNAPSREDLEREWDAVYRAGLGDPSRW